MSKQQRSQALKYNKDTNSSTMNENQFCKGKNEDPIKYTSYDLESRGGGGLRLAITFVGGLKIVKYKLQSRVVIRILGRMEIITC